MDWKWIHPDAPLAHQSRPDDAPATMLFRDTEATAHTLGEDGIVWKHWMDKWIPRWEGLCSDALAPLGIPKHPFGWHPGGNSAFQPATMFASSEMVFLSFPMRLLVPCLQDCRSFCIAFGYGSFIGLLEII